MDSAGYLFSICRLYLVLQDFDGVQKSLLRIGPEEQFDHFARLLQVSETKVINENALSYCWSGILEAISRLVDLEQQSMRNGPDIHKQWSLRFEHIYSALPRLKLAFDKFSQIRGNEVHSDINSRMSFFANDSNVRANIQKILGAFINEVLQNKKQILLQICMKLRYACITVLILIVQ